MKKTLLLCFVFFAITLFSAIAEVKPIQSASQPSQFFIENKGQWDEQVLFLARLGGLDYWITNSGATYDYYFFEREPIPEPKPLDLEDAKDPSRQIPKIKNWYGHVIKNSLVGMNKNFNLAPMGKKEGIFNYFLGNDESEWVTNVSTYSSVKIQNIYDGIDIVYFYENESIRYDFEVKAFSDPNQIKMKFEGQEKVSITPNGDLLFTTSIGEVAHTKLYAYQELNGTKKQIECKFIDKGDGVIAFNVSGFDPSKPLTIDPTVVFITYFGRNNTDYVFSTAIDPSGQTIQTGYTYSTNLPVTSGAYQSSIQTTPCGYVVKMNAAGNGLIFCTYLGGNNSTYPYGGCGSDQNGNTYVAGYTYATNFPVTSGAFQTTYSTFPEMFITKLNTTGSALGYSTYLGGNNTDVCYGMHADLNGFAYVTGYTYSTNYPTSSGAFQSTMPYSSYPNVFVTKLNQNGNALAMSSFYGSSSGYGYGYGVSSDGNGNPYVTGYCYATNFPTTAGAFKTSGTTTPEIFVAKFNASGTSLSYATYLNGNNTDIAYNISVDPDGQAAIVGYTYSSNYHITPGALQSTLSTTPEGFVTKLNSTGTGLIFSTFLGGNSTDYAYGVTCGMDGNVHVGGYTYSSNFPGITSDGKQTTISSTPDAFFTSFSPTGTKIYGTYLGGSSTDQAYYFKCVGSNAENQIVIGGITSSSNFPVTAGAYQTSVTTTYEGWMAKFQFDPPLKIATGNVIPTQFCKGDFLTVSYNVLKGYVKPANIFRIEISDEYGSFAIPRVIGQLTTTAPSGTINCQLPDNALPVSSNYKVRVTSSDPASFGDPSTQSLTVNPSPIAFSMTGENGFCANAKEGSAIGIDDSEKYYYYQLYRDGVKVGTPIAGTDQPLAFGKFKTLGMYKVEAVSPFGCKNWMSGQVEVVVIPLPTAYNMTGGGLYFDQPGPGTYCEGADGVAIGLNNGDPGVNYQLKLNGLPLSVPIQGRGDKISFGYFTDEGTYTIEALSIKGGCLNTMNGSIKVKKLPAPKVFDILSSGSYCERTEGSEIKLNGSETGFTYQVFYDGKAFGSSVPGTGSELVLGKFNKPGQYTVLATNVSTGCNKYMKGIINLSPIPSPEIFDVTGNGRFCANSEGAVLTLSNSTVDNIYELYNNNVPTGNKLVGTGAELTFPPVNTDGMYTILGSSIKGGCTNLMNGSVKVLSIPLPDVSIAGNLNPKLNTTEKYSVKNPQANESYLWKVTNGEILGDITANEITVQWGDKKSATVELYRKDAFGCANWLVQDIKFTNEMTADFAVKKSLGDVPFLVEFENKSTGYITSYLWDFGDGDISPQVNPSHTYKQTGKFTVKLTVAHENEMKTVTKSEVVTVLPPNSVEEDGQAYNSNKTAGISLIEPNPARSEIRFEYFLTFDQNIELSVFDALGNKLLNVQKGFTTAGNHNFAIDISKLSNGNYYLQLSSKDGNATQHFTIVK